MIVVIHLCFMFCLYMKAMESYDLARLYLPRLDANVMQCSVDHTRVSCTQLAPPNPTTLTFIRQPLKCLDYFRSRHSYS